MPALGKEKIISVASPATLIAFFVSGLVGSSFFSEFPTLRDHFGFSPAQMGNLLLTAALGAVIVLPTSGILIGRFGPTQIATGGCLSWFSGLLGVITAFTVVNPWLLVACFLIANVGMLLMNAAINVEAGYVEVALRKPRMGWFHASYSIGTVAGVLISVVTLRLGLSFQTHLTAILALAAVAQTWAFWHFLPRVMVREMTGRAHVISKDIQSTESPNTEVSAANAETTAAEKPSSQWKATDAWKESRTILISIMVLGTSLMEEGAADWMSLGMVDGFKLETWHGTVALAVYLIFMTSTRIISPHLLTRFAPAYLLRRMVLIGLTGVALAAFSPTYWLALVGAAMWGIGVALSFPVAASVLAADPVRCAGRMSVMSTFTFQASIIGPFVVGNLAEVVGYQRALAIILIPGIISMILTAQLRKR